MEIKTFIILAALTLATAGLSACSGNSDSDSADTPRNVKVISPVSEGNAIVAVSDTMPDGGYHIAFDATAIDSDGSVEVEFFSFDMYTPATIDSLAVGDRIVILGEETPIASLDRNIDDSGRKTVTVNGTNTAGGHTLYLEDDGLYHAALLDGFPEYYSAGKRKLQLASNVYYTDDSDPVARVDAKGPAAIAGVKNPAFDPNSSSIVLKGNVITHVNRIWVP